MSSARHFISTSDNINQSIPYSQQDSSYRNENIANFSVLKQYNSVSLWNNQYALNLSIPIKSLPLRDFVRSVSSIFPGTPDIKNQCRIPFSINISPISVSQVPMINYYYNLGLIPNCSSCFSYLCPKCKITILNGKYSWSCAICGKANFFPNISDSKYEIPFRNLIESSNLVYDILAPSQYYHMYGQPAFAFIIDMSYNAFSTGFTHQFLTTIQQIIDIIPSNSRLCIITMSDELSIFDFKKHQEIVIPDVSELCLAGHQESFFPLLCECKQFLLTIIKLLLSRVPANKTAGNCLLSAMIITEMIMKGIGGIALVSCVNTPKEGPYKLKNRTGNSEMELLQIASSASGKSFHEEALRLNKSGISVHLFCSYEPFDENILHPFCDIPTISILSRLTNGKCHFYGFFDDFQRKNLHNDLIETLSCQHMWNSSLQIQYSYGLKIKKIYSNCQTENKNSFTFPVLSKNDTIIFEFDIEKPILQAQILIQICIHFTTDEGKRIIRVFTVEIPKSNDPNSIIQSIDEASLISVLTRQAISRSLEEGPQKAYDSIRNEIVQLLSNGKKYHSLIYFANSLLCSRVLRNFHPLGVDGRMATFIELNEMSNIDLLLYLYPRLFCVKDTEFSLLPLKMESCSSGSCFLFHTNNKIFIWIRANIDSKYLKNAFGADSFDQVPNEMPKIETQENAFLRKLMNDCCTFSGKFLPNEIICERNPRESIIFDMMVDDSISLRNLMNDLNL